MKKTCLAAGIALSSCLIPLEARAASFTGLNVFGDSLVDSGNLFNLTSELFVPLGFPAIPPSPPYAQKNSNGSIWIDNLGEALDLSPTLVTDLLATSVPTSPPAEGINFAFAGSLSSDIHILDDDFPFFADRFPGFQEQIDSFQTLAATFPADPDALYIVWVGANDYNEAFFNPGSLGSLTLEQLPNVVTDNIINGITQLNSLGAEYFLVANLPPLGEAPFSDFLDTQAQQDISSVLNQLSEAHNDLLSAKLSAFGQSQSNANITTLDINTLFVDVLADPGAFNLANVTESCLINFQPGFQFDGVCNNPNEFLFWDDTHPTTAAYQLVSDLALVALNGHIPPASVPEPGSIAPLLAMGILGAGTALTQRR